jgi:hypothetical protein
LILTGGCQHFQAEVPVIDGELAQAEACWRQQDFACADRLLTPAMEPPAVADPRAIYLAGLVAVDSRNPSQDIEKACQCFQQLTTHHPETLQAANAEVWLGLIRQLDAQAEAINGLEDGNARMQQTIEEQQATLRLMKNRLERLKAVDLSLE